MQPNHQLTAKQPGNKMRGTALFMSLLIVAIVATLVATLTRLQQVNIRLTQLLLTSEQAYLYSQGVIDWAIGAIILTHESTNPSVKWPLILPPTSIANGTGNIAGTLQDANALFNINNIANNLSSSQMSTDQQAILLKLLARLNLRITKEQQQQLVAAITAWLNPSTAFDDIYLTAHPSYRSPHMPMASISELRAVAGVSAEIYQRLLPYITALPSATTINIAHASPLLLQALEISPEQLATAQQAASTTKLSDHYYLLTTQVNLATHHFNSYCLLRYSFPNNIPRVEMLWQSFGTL